MHRNNIARAYTCDAMPVELRERSARNGARRNRPASWMRSA
jgi:hypothetical protein